MGAIKDTLKQFNHREFLLAEVSVSAILIGVIAGCVACILYWRRQ